MICTNCNTLNEAGRKFCMECGARLATGCPNCGAQNPDEAKFCGECGTAFAASAQPATAGPAVAPSGSSERRLVTVLFADLVGFTTLAADQDPEDTRDLLTRYFELTRTIIERYGGTIEKFIGDAVMAVWGAPTAFEDDAERAVRAALDIVSNVPSLGDRFEVQVRAGLLTGEAAVTIGATGQGMVAGDLVNTASRLQSVAPPGTVLVGESTYHAASGAIAFEEAGEQLLKGKAAPVPAWRATAVVALRGGSGRSGAIEPPFTGRDEELRLLKELFHSAEREGRARLAAVIGQGGIGKSRLAWEFEKYIDGVVDTVYWHYGRSPAYGEGISYWALAEMVRGRAGIAETDAPDVARAKLREAVDEWLADEQERRWVEPRIAALLALEPMPPGSRDELFAAWRAFFERVAERGPTVMIFEDLQWADEGMLDFIAELLDRSRNKPIFVVALARPEMNERHPGWGASVRNISQMSLEPLAPEQMHELVRGSVPGISDDAAGAIVGRAEGIPLYAVETIRMLIDRGDLVAAGDGTYEMRSTLDNLAVPETLHALIAARLDALGDADRRLMQTAAVVGQSFTADALAAIAGDGLDSVRDRLSAMVQRQLVAVDHDPRSPERGQYQFVQAVVKEVAEGSLSRADRRTLHVAAARYYESLGDDELAGVLASHYGEAYKASSPGPEAEALAAQARVSLRAAADRAFSLHSYRQAFAYVEQTLAVTTDRAEMIALHERAAIAANLDGRFDIALHHAQAVETISRDAGDRMGVLRGVAAQATVHMGEHGERPAIAILRPALESVADLDPTPDIVAAQAELGRALMVGGDYSESVEWCNRVLAAKNVATDLQCLEALITKGTALAASGHGVEGTVLLRGAIQTADASGHTFAALRARNNLLGNLESVKADSELIEEGYEIAERHGQRTWMYQFAHVAVGNSFERGDWDFGVERAEALEAPGFYKSWLVAEMAIRAAFRGEGDFARSELTRAAEIAGSDSSQALSNLQESRSALSLAAGDMTAVLAGADEGLLTYENAELTLAGAMAAAAALNDAPVVLNVREAYLKLERPALKTEAHIAALETVAAMAEGRWSDARSRFAVASRLLAETSHNLGLALLNLALGLRGAGHVPEAAQALESGERYFRAVGAESFVERYRAAFVPGSSSVSTVASVESTSEVTTS